MLQNIAKQDTRIDRLPKGKAASKGVGNEKVDQVAEEFEAQFISQMLENMFTTVEPNSAFGGGEAEKTYRALLVDEYGKMMVKAGGIGVADHIKRELLRFQEAPSAPQQSSALPLQSQSHNATPSLGVSQ